MNENHQVPRRYRFRTLVRLVLANRDWLRDVEEIRFTDHLKRNVSMVIRRRGKKGILTLPQKAMLIKNPDQRSANERMQLASIIAALKCFSRYPPNVRSSLSRVTFYMFFPAGRVLVREGQIASAMYFILDGEISVSQKEYDPIEKVYIDKTVGVMGPGDMFGEVALLNKIPRTATCTSATDVELLCVFSADFDRILRDTLQSQWEQVLLAVQRFDYFRNWNKVQLRECCILAKIKEYQPTETIYCEDRGLLNFVHFVISGKCVILQCLKMKTRITNGKKKFELSEMKLDTTPTDEIMGKIKHSAEELYRKRTLPEPELPEEVAKRINMNDQNIDEALENVLNSELTREVLNKSPKPCFLYSMHGQDNNISNSGINTTTEYEFIDVGTLSCGAVFGLGERMEDRTIMARTRVQCLLIPRYWLCKKEQNLGNIWSRTRMFLDVTIPSREALFKNFLNTRKWNKFRKDLIKNTPTIKHNRNPTKIDDVPIICQIVDGVDIDE